MITTFDMSKIDADNLGEIMGYQKALRSFFNYISENAVANHGVINLIELIDKIDVTSQSITTMLIAYNKKLLADMQKPQTV